MLPRTDLAMEAKELFERSAGEQTRLSGVLARETDRRGVTISLTDAGRAALPAPADPDAAFSALTDAERAELKTLLQKLLASWEETRE